MLVKGKFEIDGAGVWRGWHNPEVDWNGWACPCFVGVVAEDILQKICESNIWIHCDWDKQGDVYRYWESDDTGDYLDMLEWTGEDVEVEGDMAHVYWIGAYAWIWNEVE